VNVVSFAAAASERLSLVSSYHGFLDWPTKWQLQTHRQSFVHFHNTLASWFWDAVGGSFACAHAQCGLVFLLGMPPAVLLLLNSPPVQFNANGIAAV
jgi:hypothetical protein